MDFRLARQPGQHFPVELQQILIIIKQKDFMADGHIWFTELPSQYNPCRLKIASNLQLYRRNSCGVSNLRSDVRPSKKPVQKAGG